MTLLSPPRRSTREIDEDIERVLRSLSHLKSSPPPSSPKKNRDPVQTTTTPVVIQPPLKRPASKESKENKDPKAKETKTKETKAKETKAKETKTKDKETKAKETKAKETKTKDKETKVKQTKPKKTEAKETKLKETKSKEEFEESFSASILEAEPQKSASSDAPFMPSAVQQSVRNSALIRRRLRPNLSRATTQKRSNRKENRDKEKKQLKAKTKQKKNKKQHKRENSVDHFVVVPGSPKKEPQQPAYSFYFCGLFSGGDQAAERTPYVFDADIDDENGAFVPREGYTPPESTVPAASTPENADADDEDTDDDEDEAFEDAHFFSESDGEETETTDSSDGYLDLMQQMLFKDGSDTPRAPRGRPRRYRRNTRSEYSVAHSEEDSMLDSIYVEPDQVIALQKSASTLTHSSDSEASPMPSEPFALDPVPKSRVNPEVELLFEFD